MNDANLSDSDDADLFLCFRDGNDRAFDEIVTRYHESIYRFFYRFCHRSDEAEDLTQEVFIKLYRCAAGYEKTAKFSTFVYRIARNCWMDVVRKKNRRVKESSLDSARNDDLHPLHEKLASSSPTPLHLVQAAELDCIIHKAVDELSEEHRAVFILSVFQELKYSDIAEVLSIPVGTVKSRMFHAVSKLREKLVLRSCS